MELEKLGTWLEANGWRYERSGGKLRITNPHFGTRTTYPLSVVEESSLQNLLLPHFLEGWHKSGGRGEYLGAHHLQV